MEQATRTPGSPSTPREAPAVNDFCDIVLWLMPAVNRFPREHRFVLGDRILASALDVLELLIRASFSHDRLKILDEINIKLEVMRRLVRRRWIFIFSA